MDRLKTVSLILLFCFSPLFSCLQTTVQDSLRNLISIEPDDSSKARLLIEMAVSYKRLDRRKQHQYALEAYRLLDQANSDRLKVQALHVLGDSYLNMNQPSDSALIYFEQGISLAQEIVYPAKEADCINGIGAFYHQFGIYDRAFEYYQQAMAIAAEEGLKEALCRYQNNMALILMRQENFDSALDHFYEALETSEEIDNKLITSALLSNIGIIHASKGEFDLALEKYNRSLEVRRINNDKVGEVLTICNIGNVYRRKKMFERAFAYTNEGLTLAEDIDFKRGKSTCLEAISLSYFDSKQYDQTIQLAKEGLEVSEKIGFLSSQVEFKGLLAASYAALAEHSLAYEYHLGFTELKDSLTSLERLQKVNDLEAKYRLSQKEAENQIRQQEVIKRRNIIIFAVLGLLLLSSLLAVSYYRSSKQKHQYNQLLQAAVEERTSELNQSVEMLKHTNRELERFAFIASHDLKEPLRSIVSFNNLIQRKLKGTVSSEIEEYFDFVNKSGQQMYQLIESSLEFSRLSKMEIVTEPADLNQILLQVEESLQGLVQQRKASIEYGSLPIIQSNPHQLFLVFKNLIENGIKYNNSESPCVTIHYSKNQAHQFLISDNGIGIPEEFHEQVFKMFKRLHNKEEYTGSGLGLAIVRKVVKRLGGEVQIDRSQETGSTFIVSLPLLGA